MEESVGGHTTVEKWHSGFTVDIVQVEVTTACSSSVLYIPCCCQQLTSCSSEVLCVALLEISRLIRKEQENIRSPDTCLNCPFD